MPTEPRMTNNQDDWMGRALKLEAENKRLRAALEEVAKESSISHPNALIRVGISARKALEQYGTGSEQNLITPKQSNS